jgi:hypothetical protein
VALVHTQFRIVSRRWPDFFQSFAPNENDNNPLKKVDWLRAVRLTFLEQILRCESHALVSAPDW